MMQELLPTIYRIHLRLVDCKYDVKENHGFARDFFCSTRKNFNILIVDKISYV